MRVPRVQFRNQGIMDIIWWSRPADVFCKHGKHWKEAEDSDRVCTKHVLHPLTQQKRNKQVLWQVTQQTGLEKFTVNNVRRGTLANTSSYLHSGRNKTIMNISKRKYVKLAKQIEAIMHSEGKISQQVL